MALINCRECGKEVSTEAKACPHCGAKVPRESAFAKVALIIFGVFCLILIFGSLGDHPSTEASGQNKDECARLMVDSIKLSKGLSSSERRDDSERILRANPQAKIVCSGLEINGVKIIP